MLTFRRLLLPILLAPVGVHAQEWTQLEYPGNGRCDDIFFLNADTGWVADGGSGRILRTYNGGLDWSVVFESQDYLRSIEFLDAQNGFCGSLSQTLYRTVDGGNTWTDISDQLPQQVYGVCGLSAAGPQTMYGTGVFHGAPYVIKSSDAGGTWQHTDMAQQVGSLVDVLFFNEVVGLVAGGSYMDTTGARILRTTDGGASWTEVFQFGDTPQWFWKLQSPDGVHVYASLEGNADLSPRVARSNDAGQTWTMEAIDPNGARLQGVGFITPQLGWAGDQACFRSSDGGVTWAPSDPIPGFNRFHRVSDELAFAAGYGIFRYGTGSIGVPPAPAPAPLEHVAVHPNPNSGNMRIHFNAHNASWVTLRIYNAEGRLVERLIDGRMPAGQHEHQADLRHLPAGTYTVLLYTFHGATRTRFVKQ